MFPTFCAQPPADHHLSLRRPMAPRGHCHLQASGAPGSSGARVLCRPPQVHPAKCSSRRQRPHRNPRVGGRKMSPKIPYPDPQVTIMSPKGQIYETLLCSSWGQAGCGESHPCSAPCAPQAPQGHLGPGGVPLWGLPEKSRARPGSTGGTGISLHSALLATVHHRWTRQK